MTVKSDQRKIIYQGNGTTTQFAVPFYFIQNADIQASVNDGTTTTDLVLGTDYTLTGAGVETGGTLTTVSPVASGSEIAILRTVAYKQEMDIPENDIFPSQNMERALDRLTMQTQQLAEQVSRSVTIDVFSDADPSEIVKEIEVIYANKDDVIAVAQSITDVNAVSADLTNVDIVATNISNVNTVAGDIANVNTVAGDKTNIDAVAGDISRVGLVADDIASVHTVAVDISNVIDVAGNKTNIDTVAGVSADVSTVAGIAADVSAVAAIDDDVSDVADDLTNIDAVAGDLMNINAVAGDLTNIDAVASDLTNVDAVSAALTNVGTVAGSIANVNAVGTDISNVNAVSADLTNINTAATNISDINTAAANIAAIIDAPNQASAAAASATLAQDWASKTDGPVEGSEYSAKWYALNTDASGKADKDLSNLTATGEAHFADPSLSNLTNGLANTICTTPATTTSTASSATPAVVVENYKDSVNWYRVWSDGWIEQGGYVSATTAAVNQTVNLNKAFTTPNFFAVAALAAASTVDLGSFQTDVFVKTTTSFKTVHSANKYWYACGY